MLELTEGVAAVRIASLWLLCTVEQGKIVNACWQSSWTGEESRELRRLFEASQADAMVALPYVSLRGTPFQCSVWRAVMRIPFGSVLSYAALGRSIGCHCAQAIGQALKRNQIMWFVPCHRVIAASGALGGYSPGEDYKRILLRYESSLPN